MYIFKITVIKVILFRARTYFSKAAEAAPAGVDLDGLHLLLARFDLHGSGINVKTKNYSIFTQSNLLTSTMLSRMTI